MKILLHLIAIIGQFLTYLGHIFGTYFTSVKSMFQKQTMTVTTSIFLLIILISKEFIIFNEEIIVVVSFFSFIYFVYTKINDMIYLELVSRNEKIYREADLNLFYHQKIINAILELYKVASYIQNKLKNEYIFFRHVFLLNLWPCKAINYINTNISNIEKNFNIIYNDKHNLYQELQTSKNIFDYELIKNLSKGYMYN